MPSEETVLLTPSKNPFAMFAPRPYGVSFEDQETGEKIILLLRAHVVTLVPSILATLILILIPFLLFLFLQSTGSNFFSFLSPREIFWVVVFWYLLAFGYAFYSFIFWYFNVDILTNERIVDVNFEGILSKEVSHARLDRIQDVSPTIVGFFGTFFNYGDVFIQTAAEQPEFRFKRVARPEIVAKVILDQARLITSGGGGV